MDGLNVRLFCGSDGRAHGLVSPHNSYLSLMGLSSPAAHVSTPSTPSAAAAHASKLLALTAPSVAPVGSALHCALAIYNHFICRRAVAQVCVCCSLLCWLLHASSR